MRRILCVLLAVLLLAAVLTALPVSAEEEKPTSGVTGDCTWEFKPATGELVIEGNGAMADYPPWKEWLPVWFQLYENDVTSVVIGDGVTHIGNNAFRLFWRVDAVHLGSSVQSIGDGAFIYCPIVSVTIPEGCTYIGDYAFHDCELEEVVMPDTVTYIGEKAFYYNLYLSRVNISQNAEIIGDWAFGHCYFQTLTIPDTVTTIGERAFISNRITQLTIGKNVKTIRKEAFWGNPLEEVVISDSVETIGEKAFYCNRQLTAVTIPPTVLAIGEHAFGYYYFEDTEFEPIDGFTISGCHSTAAQTYALENGFTFVDITPPPTLLGDADGSSDVDINDVTAVQYLLAELAALTGEGIANADVDHNGVLDIADATRIQMFIAEYIHSFE